MFGVPNVRHGRNYSENAVTAGSLKEGYRPLACQMDPGDW